MTAAKQSATWAFERSEARKRGCSRVEAVRQLKEEALTSTRSFYNASLDISVRFTSSTEFVVIGDEKKVSDNTLLSLSIGSLPEGWVKSNG